MTLKAKVGSVSGSRDQPSVVVTVFDDAGATLDYNAALAAAIAVSPATVFGANLATSDVGISEKSRDAITFEMRYRRPGRNILLREVDAQTQSKKLHHFVEPVGVFDSEGDATSLYQSLKWKPDRQDAASEFNSGKPIVVDPLPNSRRLRFSTSQSFVTDNYIDMVEDMVTRGVFNSEIYLGRPPGTLQLVQFSISENDLVNWSLAFGFGYRGTRTNVSVGDGITIPTLRGCDYYWLKEVEVFADGKVQPKVEAAIVGQAWELVDFSVLNMPYPGRLTMRSTNFSGTVTTLEGHGIAASDDVVLIWDGGRQVANCTGTTSTTVSFGSGTGDALPPLHSNLLIATYVP